MSIKTTSHYNAEGAVGVEITCRWTVDIDITEIVFIGTIESMILSARADVVETVIITLLRRGTVSDDHAVMAA